MPSVPQSLLWISLVVLWLFVLVPMLISKRDAVRRTSDVALATRVLNSAGGRRLRRGPAAGHRSDPDWQPQDDLDEELDDEDPERAPRAVVVSNAGAGAKDDPAVAGAEPDYLDVDVVEEDSGALPVGSTSGEAFACQSQSEAEPESVTEPVADAFKVAKVGAREGAAGEAAAFEAVSDQAVSDQTVAGAAVTDEVVVGGAVAGEAGCASEDEVGEGDAGQSRSAKSGVAEGGVGEPLASEHDGTEDEYEYVEDTSGLESGDDPATTASPTPSRRRRMYESKTAAAVSARKYKSRRRTVCAMALVLAVSAAAAFTVWPAGKWLCASVGAITLIYLAYLRRQTRIEERLRRRRMQRMARSRLGVENTADKEFDVAPSRLRRPGAVVLEIDDEDPIFEHLDYAPGAAEYQLPRAAGQ